MSNPTFMCEIRKAEGQKVYLYASIDPMGFEIDITSELLMKSLQAMIGHLRKDNINTPQFSAVLDRNWLNHPKGTPIEFNSDKRFCIVRPK